MRIAWAVVLIALAAPAQSAEVTGKIAVKLRKGQSIEAGYVGTDGKGRIISNFAGSAVGNGATKVTCTTWKPRNTSVSWDPAKGCSFQHVGLPAGAYVFFAKLTAEQGGAKIALLTDWRRISVPSVRAKLNLGLRLDSSLCGSLAVTAPGRQVPLGVTLIPADEKGRPIVSPDTTSFGPAVEADLGPRSTRVDGLREGTYRLWVREVHRQKTGKSAWVATYNDIGDWTVHVRAGQVTRFQVPPSAKKA